MMWRLQEEMVGFCLFFAQNLSTPDKHTNLVMHPPARQQIQSRTLEAFYKVGCFSAGCLGAEAEFGVFCMGPSVLDGPD